MNHTGAKFDDYLGSSYPHCMYVNFTCVSEIKNILSGMQSKNSCGLDEIPMSILKLSPDNILLILCHIFNLSLGQGKFINEFKKAKIIPVHKKGSKSDVNNYRPISLLPVMSKILERIFYKRLCSFLSQVDFFYQYQFGFRKKHSTSNALTVMVENVTKAFEEKKWYLWVICHHFFSPGIKLLLFNCGMWINKIVFMINLQMLETSILKLGRVIS